MSLKSAQYRIVIVLGLLALLAANLRFNVTGVTDLTSDPREIVALTAVFFLYDWRAALVVGLLAGLGGPYDTTLWITVMMHIAAIPAAYFLYQLIRRSYKNQWVISILWFISVQIVYYLIFAVLFVAGHYFAGDFSTILLTETYQNVVKGLLFEALMTSSITVLILQIKLSREERDYNSQLLGLLVKSNEFGLWDWQVKNDKFTVNEQFASMLGYNSVSFANSMQKFKKLIHDEDIENFTEDLQSLIKGAVPLQKAEYRVRTKEDTWKCFFSTGKVVEWDELNRPLRIIGTNLDISESKNAEKENKKLKEQMIQVQKMEAIGTLAGGIAHDFNNLLTVINGHAEIAAMRLDEEAPAYKDVMAIHSAGERAARLTKQLLAFSRKEKITLQVLNINTIILDMDKLLRRLIGEDILITSLLGDGIPPITGDSGQLEQILINLVVNARDAINSRQDELLEKKIIIETQRAKLENAHLSEYNYVPSGEYLLITVSDNGIGMNADTRKKIFEPFFTTKSDGKGTGLGLATVYGIVKQNQGFINIDSEIGKGTTFKIFWPFKKTKGPVQKEDEVSTADFSGIEQILLVEDDTAVREFSAAALRSFGYLVKEATNGREALSMIEVKEIQPQLLITDLVMPHLNGKELAARAIQLIPGCSVLFTSGYTDNHLKLDGALQEKASFIHKPYSVHTLLKATRQILDGKKPENS